MLKLIQLKARILEPIEPDTMEGFKYVIPTVGALLIMILGVSALPKITGIRALYPSLMLLIAMAFTFLILLCAQAIILRLKEKRLTVNIPKELDEHLVEYFAKTKTTFRVFNLIDFDNPSITAIVYFCPDFTKLEITQRNAKKTFAEDVSKRIICELREELKIQQEDALYSSDLSLKENEHLKTWAK